MEADSIIKYLNEQFPALSFFYLKKEFKNKNVYEFFFSGSYEGSVMFDLLKLQEQNEPLLIIKNSIISFIKRTQIKENNEDESKIKKVWKKS